MHTKTLALLLAALALLAAGAFLVPHLFDDSMSPPMRWSEQDEVDLPPDADAGIEGDAAEAMQRTAMATAEDVDPAGETRVAALLRGRVVDTFGAPVAGARVWLDFGRQGPRGGAARQRRVPAPVETDREGRFAFEGQTFRMLRVSLQVLHAAHAPGLFDKDVGEVNGEVDLGDLVLNRGGELVGRVTDLDGNGIAAAELRLQPENNNRMRMLRDRENLIAAFQTDNNGFFRRPAVPAGDWSITASARMHTEGRSAVFAAEDGQVVDIEDIRLGPGYEVSGYVRTVQGQPIAKAEVTMRSEGREGARGPGGREHRATTDEQGRFFLEHLPGATMRLEARAEGFLDFEQQPIDPTLGQQLHVAMQDGLKITGTAQDEDGTPVTSFAVRAVRIRGLPQPGQQNLDELVSRLRSGDLDEATRAQIRTQIESLRSSAGFPSRRNGRDEGGGPRGPGRDLGRPTQHAGGEFVLAGLQEGVYEVQLESGEHARFRSAEIEVRLDAAPPHLQARLDRGVYVAGIVSDDQGVPIAGARVTLRNPAETAGAPRRGRGAEGPDFEAMRDFARQAAAAWQRVEVTTDADGEFVLKHVTRGSWRLQATAEGFSDATTEPFDLQADRSGVNLRLGSLGALAGRVRGLASSEHGDARVGAMLLPDPASGFAGFFGRGRGGGGSGPFQSVAVAADGTYRIEKLEPGAYVVRSWIGSPQDLMRELMPKFADGSLAADVTVRGGETAQLDLGLHRPQIGVVAGAVVHNGAPGTGLQVELTPQAEPGATAEVGPRGGFGGRGGMFGFGRSLQAAVGSSGRFQIDSVPAGIWRLRVQSSRRGAALHEEIVQVVAGARAECNIVLVTQELRGSVSRDDGGDPAELSGRATLLPGLAELPPDLAAWQREHPSFDARVQGGRFRFDALQAGQYLLVLTIRGRERTSQPVTLGAGESPSIVVAAGKVRETGTGARTGGAPPR
jgi:uncharacterized GH25 family protein